MIRPLPPLPPVDYDRRGVLTIAPGAVFCSLIGLAPGHEAVVFKVNAWGALEIEIAGEDMPEIGLSPAPVRLLCHRIETPAGSAVELSWEHLPEKRWQLP